MTQQNEGWPLGLEPVNARIELVRNRENAGSISFNTLLTTSPSSSTVSSSNLDTESTGSFFPEKSTTLGSLMGVTSTIELSRRTKTELFKSKKKKFNLSSWLFCLCSSNRDPKAENQKSNPPSLAQFLAVERKAANENRRNQSLIFMNGTIAPPHSISPRQSIETERESVELRHHNKGFASLAVLFSCMCGQDAFG